MITANVIQPSKTSSLKGARVPVTDIMNLPWASVLFFSAGYAGYFIANSGIRDHHKQIDTAFSTAVFGFFSLMIYRPMLQFGLDSYYASLPAFLGAMLAGGAWRKWGRDLFSKSLRWAEVSYVNDFPAAWQEMIEKRGVQGSQLSVVLKDGSEYCCDDLHRFARAPNGPCILGSSGDVLMYPTDVKRSPNEEWEAIESTEHDWGYEAFWFPAGEIKTVKYRRATS